MGYLDKLTGHITGETNQKGMYIMCKDAAHCSGFQFSNIVLTGAVSFRHRQQALFKLPQKNTDCHNSLHQNGKPGEMQCTGLNGVEGMGIPCTNGTLS